PVPSPIAPASVQAPRRNDAGWLAGRCRGCRATATTGARFRHRSGVPTGTAPRRFRWRYGWCRSVWRTGTSGSQGDPIKRNVEERATGGFHVEAWSFEPTKPAQRNVALTTQAGDGDGLWFELGCQL